MGLRARHLLPIAPLALVAGCALHSPAPRLATAAPAAPPAAVAEAGGALAEARAALGARNGAAAVSFAELAVRAAPQASAPRETLARAYYAAGRMRAATDAYGDWLAAAPDEPRALLGLALTRIAAGDAVEALGALERAADRLDASDHGLALALAGDTARAVAVLGEAARQPGATARTRQNLALALALSGDWAKARAVAAQDLPAEAIAPRLAEWAALANRGPDRAPLLALLGVTPAESDPGRPMQLAWGASADQPALAGTVAPAPVEPTPAPPAEAPPPVAVAEAATVEPATVPPPPAGVWTVQIGAFADAAAAEAGWARLAGTTELLARLTPMTATAARLHRLTVGSFASGREALAFCRRLQATGVDCFARRSETPPALPGRVTIAARR